MEQPERPGIDTEDRGTSDGGAIADSSQGMRAGAQTAQALREQDEHISGEASLRSERPSTPQRRIQAFAAIAAMLVVVVLLATVLRTLAAGRGAESGKAPVPAATSTIAPTATSSASPTGQWVDVPGLANGNRIYLAPGDPRVAYAIINTAATITTSSGAVKTVQTYSGLGRTDNAGASWQAISLPTLSNPPPQNVNLDDLFISPLDAQRVYVSLSVQGSICSSIAAGPPFQDNGTLSCNAQYYSTDGGAHWHLLKLPVAGELATTPTIDGSLRGGKLQAQGTNLYSTASRSVGNGVQPDGRLVISSDSGATWRTADDALIARGLGVDEYTATRTGSTLFALAEPVDSNLISIAGSAHPPQAPHLTLWRSDDAGNHWALVGSPPPSAYGGLRAVNVAGSAQPLLYQVVTNANTNTTGTTPGDVEVSGDGGHTWKAAPTAGVSSNASSIDAAEIGVLPDGHALLLFGTTLYEWKAGEAAWRQAAPPLTNATFTDALFIVPPTAGQPTTLWALVETASTAYDVRRLALENG